MPKQVLVLVETGPEHPGKSAEALRVAEGVRPWGGLEITICFAGRGLSLLNPAACPDSLSENLGTSLKSIHEAGIPVICLGPIQNQCNYEEMWKIPIRLIEDSEWTALLGRCDILLRYAV